MAFDRKCVVGKPEFQVLFPLRLLELPGPSDKMWHSALRGVCRGSKHCKNCKTALIEVLIVEKVGSTRLATFAGAVEVSMVGWFPAWT